MTIKLTIYFRHDNKHPKYQERLTILHDAFDLLPNNIKGFFYKNPVMFGTQEDEFCNAICLTHECFKDEKALILLLHHVWKFKKKMIFRVIFHELAHAYLGHHAKYKTGTLSKKDEDDANRLANKWLKNYKN